MSLKSEVGRSRIPPSCGRARCVGGASVVEKGLAMKASPLAHLSKWRRLAPAVALLVVAFALVVGPARQALAQDGPQAFAVYSSTDNTLTIYKASDKPEVGDTYHGKTVSQVFGINEETEWFRQTPFYSAKDSIERVIFAEPEDQNNKIAPVSMRKWFDGVSNLRSVEGWENVDGSKLTDMSYLFYGTRLANIDLSALGAPNLETIEKMFESCLELKTANLSGLVTASTTDAANLFLGCSNLMSVDVSGWDTSEMESMASMFQRCRDLTELDLSSWTTTDAVNMKWMFNESGITKVTLGTGFSFGSSPSQTSLPDAEGCLWYKLDDSGSPIRPGYTGEELATSWDGSTMAGTWQLTTELEEPKPKPAELADLTASDSLTYGETLTVTFTPKSDDDVIASGTATLKLGDTVLATVSEPQADGSFSLSYNTADKGVALGGQTLTVTFESTGYEAATGTVETTLSAKSLTVEVTSSLDKTWDGSDEVDGLAVELLGALEDDDVTVSATGAYASSNAGEQDVTLTLALSGDDAAWYTVSAPTDLTGTINAADIVGKLSLSGTPAFGETLTATYEPTSGEQVSYTWTRDGQVIDGATGSTYTLTKEDVGAQIAVGHSQIMDLTPARGQGGDDSAHADLVVIGVRLDTQGALGAENFRRSKKSRNVHTITLISPQCGDFPVLRGSFRSALVSDSRRRAVRSRAGSTRQEQRRRWR